MLVALKHATHLFLEWASGWVLCGWPGWRVGALQARHLLSGRSGCGLAAGDEGVGLDLHAVVGELDLAVHRLPPVVMGGAAAGDRAAEPLGPLGQGAEAAGVLVELRLTCCPASETLKYTGAGRSWFSASKSAAYSASAPMDRCSRWRDHGHVAGDLDRGLCGGAAVAGGRDRGNARWSWQRDPFRA